MTTELYHYGVKGMKWGVRRYRNTDGSLTSAGKKQAKAQRDGSSDDAARKKQLAKKVAVGVLATATVAAAAYAYSKNPDAVNKFVSKAAKKTVSSIKAAPKKAANAAKTAAKEAVRGVKDGVKEGIYNAPKTAAKTAITGMTMLAAKRLLDSYVGKEEAERIFKANNKKKIDSFWKVQSQDDKDDD